MNYKIKIHFLISIILLLSTVAFPQEKKVTIPFNVIDQNGVVLKDLKISDLQIFHDKMPLRTDSLVVKSDLPLEILILIDASGSQEKMLPIEKIAAEIFINAILKKEKDKVAIAKFSGTMSVEQSLTNDFEAAKQKLKNIKFEPPEGYVGGGLVIGSVPMDKKQIAKGSTSIWDAVNEAVSKELTSQNSNTRRIVLLISDGVNTYGKTKLDEVIIYNIKNHIPIYAIGIGDKNYDGVDEKALKKLTDSTGGELILPKKTVGELLQQILNIESGLRSYYELTAEIKDLNANKSLIESEIRITTSDINAKKTRLLQPKGFFVQ